MRTNEFRIYMFRPDGELSVCLITLALGIDDAAEQAERLVTHATPKAEIWSDGSLVKTIRAETGSVISLAARPAIQSRYLASVASKPCFVFVHSKAKVAQIGGGSAELFELEDLKNYGARMRENVMRGLGFSECLLSTAQIVTWPDLADERQRPTFLLLSATRT